MAALEKDLPYLRRPADPLPTDTPAVVKAKQAALDEYNAAAQKIQEAVKGMNPEGLSPEKATEAIARINANALVAVTLKTHVIPKVMRELQSSQARIKELEAEVGRYKAAGRLSQAHGSAPDSNRNSGGGRGEPTDLASALLEAGGNMQG